MLKLEPPTHRHSPHVLITETRRRSRRTPLKIGRFHDPRDRLFGYVRFDVQETLSPLALTTKLALMSVAVFGDQLFSAVYGRSQL
jgi:hypothetical protein